MEWTHVEYIPAIVWSLYSASLTMWALEALEAVERDILLQYINAKE